TAIRRHGVKARVQSFGSVWALYFTEQPVRNYRDQLPQRSSHFAALRGAYRDHLLRHGIFANAHPGNRAFLSAAHTDDDASRIVEATGGFFADYKSQLC